MIKLHPIYCFWKNLSNKSRKSLIRKFTFEEEIIYSTYRDLRAWNTETLEAVEGRYVHFMQSDDDIVIIIIIAAQSLCAQCMLRVSLKMSLLSPARLSAWIFFYLLFIKSFIIVQLYSIGLA